MDLEKALVELSDNMLNFMVDVCEALLPGLGNSKTWTTNGKSTR